MLQALAEYPCPSLRKAGLSERACQHFYPVSFCLNMQALKSGQGIILDLDFQDLMTEQEMRSLVGQLQFAYAANCKAEVPAHLYFTSFNVSTAVSSLPLGMNFSVADGYQACWYRRACLASLCYLANITPLAPLPC